MHQFEVPVWLGLMDTLAQFESQLRANHPDAIFSDDARVDGELSMISTLCASCDLHTAAELAKEMARYAKDQKYTASKAAEDVRALKRAVVANMRSIVVVRIAEDYRGFASFRVDEGIAAKFPSASLELAQSAKALDQPPASGPRRMFVHGRPPG